MQKFFFLSLEKGKEKYELYTVGALQKEKVSIKGKKSSGVKIFFIKNKIKSEEKKMARDREMAL